MATCCNFVKTNMTLLKCSKDGFKCTQPLKSSRTLKFRNVYLLLLMSKVITEMIKHLPSLSRRWKQHVRSSLDYYLSLPNLFISHKWIFVPSGATRVNPEILNRSGALCRPPWLIDVENFRFQIVSKGQNKVSNYKFLVKYFYQHFQVFSDFIYNESFPMKSHHFFKIRKRFDKERQKKLIQQSTRKEKLRKVGLCFITDCFI